MLALQPDRELCRHRQGRGHRAQVQHATGLAGGAGQILTQAFVFVQHAPRAGQHPLTFGRQALVAAAAPHDGHAHVGLQRPQGIRQRRLGDVAGLRRAAEVAVLLQGGEVTQGVQQVHRAEGVRATPHCGISRSAGCGR
jgi:hypothetical protein